MEPAANQDFLDPACTDFRSSRTPPPCMLCLRTCRKCPVSKYDVMALVAPLGDDTYECTRVGFICGPCFHAMVRDERRGLDIIGDEKFDWRLGNTWTQTTAKALRTSLRCLRGIRVPEHTKVLRVWV